MCVNKILLSLYICSLCNMINACSYYYPIELLGRYILTSREILVTYTFTVFADCRKSYYSNQCEGCNMISVISQSGNTGEFLEFQYRQCHRIQLYNFGSQLLKPIVIRESIMKGSPIRIELMTLCVLGWFPGLMVILSMYLTQITQENW